MRTNGRITNEMLNNWWGQVDFREMEKISKYRQSDFSPEDGCQDFVDACDEWWQGLNKAEKMRYYCSYVM